MPNPNCFLEDLSTAATPHPDELRVVEDHLQTEHKLDVARSWFGAYLTIVAKAKTLPNHREAWIVDTHAGAGQHGSRVDPDGHRLGSPLIACSEARVVQKLHSGFGAHIRAIEKRPEWTLRLSARLNPYAEAVGSWERVDATVLPGDFAVHLPRVLAEAQAVRALSLWFIDPYGFLDIPYIAVQPLTEPRYGPEVIINLDLSGIWRKVGRPEDLVDVDDVALNQADQQRALTALFGDRSRWESALRLGESRAANLESLATAYADTFVEFRFRKAYRLRSSDGQVRFLVHLAHSELPHLAFARVFNDSLKRDLFAGRSLDTAARGHAAQLLHDLFKRRSTTIQEIYEEGVGGFDRSQLRAILREAEGRGYGNFNEAESVMTWTEDRRPVQAELPF